jgi:hypothetical protein
MGTVNIVIHNCGCCKVQPRLEVSGVQDIPRLRKEIRMDIGNKLYDQVAGVHIVLTANGPIDPVPLVWTVTAPDGTAIDGLSVTPTTPDGLEADVLFPEAAVSAYVVTAVATVDDETTPGTETISAVFMGSLSHSKATSLDGAITDIPRV